ncbi:MAG: hypothetical protein HS108_07240 [Planctomycetes bacterium]|jgi:hypothetical protein|nr:hypothetical protein [Planctomycetota bacterium]MCL4729923.1 hypothetical protein [Planctomycetota bacterium]
MKLSDPRTIKWIWAGGLLVLAVILGLDFTVHHHAHFPRDGISIDTLPEFFPFYGFLSCFLMVVVAKALATALQRKDTYYDDQ